MNRNDMSALADQLRGEGQVIDSITQRRTTGEDRRHAVRQLVMAARLAEAELRTLGREGMADTLRAAVRGMRGQ